MKLSTAVHQLLNVPAQEGFTPVLSKGHIDAYSAVIKAWATHIRDTLNAAAKSKKAKQPKMAFGDLSPKMLHGGAKPSVWRDLPEDHLALWHDRLGRLDDDADELVEPRALAKLLCLSYTGWINGGTNWENNLKRNVIALYNVEIHRVPHEAFLDQKENEPLRLLRSSLFHALKRCPGFENIECFRNVHVGSSKVALPAYSDDITQSVSVRQADSKAREKLQKLCATFAKGLAALSINGVVIPPDEEEEKPKKPPPVVTRLHPMALAPLEKLYKVRSILLYGPHTH